MENTANIKKPRMEEQDVGKGLAMLFVILTHSTSLFTKGGRDMNVSGGSLLCVALFGYIMGFFVVMSGYNYRKSDESWGKTILKRLKQLLPALFIAVTALWILLGAYMVIRGETTISHLFNSYLAYWITDPPAEMLGLDASLTYVGQALGPTWFIKSLLTASLIFVALADYAIQNVKRLIPITFGLLSITAVFCYFKITLPWLGSNAPAMAAIMILGTYMKKLDVYTGHESKTLYKWLNFIIAFIFVFSLQIVAPRIGMISGGRIDMVAGPIEVYITAVYSLIGTYVMLALCRPLSKVRYLSTYLKWFGRHSMLILIVHGSIMRIYCDLLGITGGDSKIRLRNILAFVLTAITMSLILMIIDKIKKGKYDILKKENNAVNQ